MTSAATAGMSPPANAEVERFFDRICTAVRPFVTPDWTTRYPLLAERVERSLAPRDEAVAEVTSPIAAPWHFESPRSGDEALPAARFQTPMPTSPLPGPGTPPMPTPASPLFLPSPAVGPASPAGPRSGSRAPPPPSSPAPTPGQSAVPPPVEAGPVPAAGDIPSEPPRLARVRSPTASVEVCGDLFLFLLPLTFLLGSCPIRGCILEAFAYSHLYGHQ